jgi:hypothetical protein
MSLYSLLVLVAIALLAIAGLTTTGVWIFWASLICVGVAALLALTGNNRNIG